MNFDETMNVYVDEPLSVHQDILNSLLVATNI